MEPPGFILFNYTPFCSAKILRNRCYHNDPDYQIAYEPISDLTLRARKFKITLKTTTRQESE